MSVRTVCALSLATLVLLFTRQPPEQQQQQVQYHFPCSHLSSSSIFVAAQYDAREVGDDEDEDDEDDDYSDGYYYYEDNVDEQVQESEEQQHVQEEEPSDTSKIDLEQSTSESIPVSAPQFEPEPPQKLPAKFRMIDQLVSVVSSQATQNVRPRSSGVADLREKFERNRAKKEQDRLERESKKKASRSNRKDTIGEINSDINQAGLTTHRQEQDTLVQNFSPRSRRHRQELDELNRQQREHLESLKRSYSLTEDALSVEEETGTKTETSATQRTAPKPRRRSSRLMEVEVDANGMTERAPIVIVYNDYPVNTTAPRKAIEKRRGFLSNPIPFVEKPVTPILTTYAKDMAVKFGCVTEEAFEEFHRNHTGRALLNSTTSAWGSKDGHDRYSSFDYHTSNERRAPSEEPVEDDSREMRRRRRANDIADLLSQLNANRGDRDMLSKVSRRKKKGEKEATKDKDKDNGAVTSDKESSNKALDDRNSADKVLTGKESDKDKPLSFREKEALKKKEKEDKKAGDEPGTSKSRLLSGPVCETQLCLACRVVVEEFGNALIRSVPDERVEYVHEVAQKDFCSSSGLNSRFGPIVREVCSSLLSNQMYSRLLIHAFEKDVKENWTDDLNITPDSIKAKQRDVCVSAGACLPRDFVYIREPVTVEEADWTSECTVCRAVTTRVEEKLLVVSKINDQYVTTVFKNVCSDLGELSPEHFAVCVDFVEGRTGLNVNGFIWKLKAYGEQLARKISFDQSFPERTCLELKMCEVWVDAETKELMLLKSLDAVYE